MTDPPVKPKMVRPGLLLVCLVIVLVAVIVGGYKITHPSSDSTPTPTYAAPQTTTPPTATPTTTIPRPSDTFLGFARYSDSVGNHVMLALTSYPLVRSTGVPSDVLSSCSGYFDTFNSDPNSTLYRQIIVNVTVTSRLSASVSFTISRMNTPEGTTTNPIRSNDATVVFVLTNSTECQTPQNFMSNGVIWKSIAPGSLGTLTVWLAYPGVVSPDFPNGIPTDLRDQSWLLPHSIKINGETSGPPVISGLGLQACAHSSRFFFTPSGAHLPASSC